MTIRDLKKLIKDLPDTMEIWRLSASPGDDDPYTHTKVGSVNLYYRCMHSDLEDNMFQNSQCVHQYWQDMEMFQDEMISPQQVLTFE